MLTCGGSTSIPKDLHNLMMRARNHKSLHGANTRDDVTNIYRHHAMYYKDRLNKHTGHPNS